MIINGGITASGLWKEEVQKQAAKGESLNISGYNIVYEGSTDITGENYTARQAQLRVENSQGRIITTLFPQHRTYPISGSNTAKLIFTIALLVICIVL